MLRADTVLDHIACQTDADSDLSLKIGLKYSLTVKINFGFS